MPFLDDAFAVGRLLAGAAAVRHVEAQRRGLAGGITDGQIEAWLGPARVLLLCGDSPPMPASPLVGTRRERVTEALTALAGVLPAWRPLLQLPIRYALLHSPTGAISASSRAWPQHVLFAEEAFADGMLLRELVVHELAHQWLYLIQEVWALEADDRTFTLPSGTADRTADEVLGAAHVAVALIRMYQATGDGPPDRIAELTRYGTGCLSVVGGLTEAGHQIAGRLKEAL